MSDYATVTSWSLHLLLSATEERT